MAAATKHQSRKLFRKNSWVRKLLRLTRRKLSEPLSEPRSSACAQVPHAVIITADGLPQAPEATVDAVVQENHQILLRANVDEHIECFDAAHVPEQEKVDHEVSDEFEGEEEVEGHDIAEEGAHASNIEKLISAMRSWHDQMQEAAARDDLILAGSIKTQRDSVWKQLAQCSCCVCYIELPSKKTRKLLNEHWYHHVASNTWTCAFCHSLSDRAMCHESLSLKLRAAQELRQVRDLLPYHTPKEAKKRIRKAVRMTEKIHGRQGKGPRPGRSAKPFDKVCWVGQLVRTERRLRLERHMAGQQAAMHEALKIFGFW